MNIKQKINEIRPLPDKVNFKRELFYTLSVTIIGFLFGLIAKSTDSISIIGDIGTNLGVWIFVGTLIAAYSHTPLLAALNLPVFLLSMLASYYIYGMLVLGFFPKAYFLGWLVVSLLSPIGSFIIWFSRGKRWPAIISAALPIAVLIAEGYPAYYTFQIPLILDLVFAIILIVLLPETRKQKLFTLVISCIFALFIAKLYLLSYLPW